MEFIQSLSVNFGAALGWFALLLVGVIAFSVLDLVFYLIKLKVFSWRYIHLSHTRFVDCPRAQCGHSNKVVYYIKDEPQDSYWYRDLIVNEHELVCGGCGERVFYTTHFELMGEEMGNVDVSLSSLRSNYVIRDLGDFSEFFDGEKT